MNTQLSSLVQLMNKKGFRTSLVATVEEAKEYVLAHVQQGQSVGIGGSMTIVGMDIVPALTKAGCRILDHHKATSKEEASVIRKAQQTCDLFLTSTNALTEKGQLVNVDGTGNRVSAMIFGPEKVIVVTGVNKIVPDLDAAMARIQAIAGPKNNVRLKRTAPCVETDRCMDCDSPQRICNVYTIIERKPLQTDLHVVIVNQELGF